MSSVSKSKSETDAFNAAPEHEIVLVRTPEERQQCYDVRIAVFHVEQKFPLETEIDEWDQSNDAVHFLLRLTPSLKPVGTIRACIPPGKKYYKLTRLAVLKDYRKFRFGAALVRYLNSWVAQDAAARLQRSNAEAQEQADDAAKVSTVDIVCHSQIPVKGFYAKFGYIAEGDEFDEDGDPHQKMVLRIPLTAPLRPSPSSFVSSSSSDPLPSLATSNLAAASSANTTAA